MATSKIKSTSKKSKAAADKFSALPFPDEALFDAQTNLSVIKGLFESIGEFIIDVDTVEFEHEATAVKAIAEKGERECEEAIKAIEKVRKPRISERQKAKAAQPAQGGNHA